MARSYQNPILQIFVNLNATDTLPLKCRGGESCCGKTTSRHLLSVFVFVPVFVFVFVSVFVFVFVSVFVCVAVEKKQAGIYSHQTCIPTSDKNLLSASGSADPGRGTATRTRTARATSSVGTTTADPPGDSGTLRMTAARASD